jgi:hypothetical protein
MNQVTKPCLLISDADAFDGEVPEDPAGGAARVPAVHRAGHQVPGGAGLQGSRELLTERPTSLLSSEHVAILPYVLTLTPGGG